MLEVLTSLAYKNENYNPYSNYKKMIAIGVFIFKINCYFVLKFVKIVYNYIIFYDYYTMADILGGFMEEVSNKKEINKRLYVIFGIMVFVQLCMMVYCFQFKKEGCHSDEMWSYGYANSYHQKDIYQDKNGKFINIDEWVDSDVLRSYITVDRGEEFEYGSVYSNQMYDLSPPLHSMVLHTISSFFPGKFSLWYAFVINMVAFVIAMIFLFKIVKLLMNEKMAMLVCLLYGFSSGAVDTCIYLRMYAMCTAMFMVIVYYMLRIIKLENGEKYWPKAIPLFLVSVAAFLTHYYMISIGGILTALFCLYMMIKKQWKRMFMFGFTMLFAFLSSIAIFPSLLKNSSNHASFAAAQTAKHANMTFVLRFRGIFCHMVKKETSIPMTMYVDYGPIEFVVSAIATAIILSPILILFRKSSWFIKAKENVIYSFKNFKTVIIGWIIAQIKKINDIYIIFMIAICLQIIVVGQTTSVYAMGPCVDRYVFYLNPIFLTIVVSAAKTFVFFVLKNKKVATWIVGILAIILISSQQISVYTTSPYYFEAELTGTPVKEMCKDKNVFIVMDSKWVLTVLTYNLYDSKAFFVADASEMEKYKDSLASKAEEGPILVMINVDSYYMEGTYDESKYLNAKKKPKDINDYNKLIKFLETFDSDNKLEEKSQETIFGRQFIMFEID